MNRIKTAFENKTAIIPFLTGGDPDIETTKKLIIAMEEAGADLIEIGIPFSDPIAEGAVIQAADIRALSNGCKIDDLFEMVKEVRMTVKIPLVFMTYLNPIFTYGKEKFMKNCKECGIDGVIVPDMPFNEKAELETEAKEYGIDIISMLIPASNERIVNIAKSAEGFLYCSPSSDNAEFGADTISAVEKLVLQAKEISDIPCAVDFGISNAGQVTQIANISDGIIISSAIVELVEKYEEESIEPVKEFIASVKNAIIQAQEKEKLYA